MTTTSPFRRALARRPLVLLAIGVVAVGASGALVPAPVGAATGVSIDLGRVTLGEPLEGGRRYDLPRFTVSNPGDEPTAYAIRVGGIDGDDDAAPDASWFTFMPAEFTLEPGQTQAVQARIDLPAGAPVGRYVALVRAELASAGEGALVGAAAAGLLRFEIATAAGRAPSGTAGAVRDGVGQVPIWGVGLVLALLLVAFLVAFGRRYRITIHRA